jgi:hypothetical protein
MVETNNLPWSALEFPRGILLVFLIRRIEPRKRSAAVVVLHERHEKRFPMRLFSKNRLVP